MLSTRYRANKVPVEKEGERNSSAYIRRQLALGILSGDYPEGTELPSVRSLVRELGAHHSTVSKAYDALSSQGVIEKRTRACPVVAPGGAAKLRNLERQAFITDELPKLISSMKVLELQWSDIIALAAEC